MIVDLAAYAAGATSRNAWERLSFLLSQAEAVAEQIGTPLGDLMAANIRALRDRARDVTGGA